MGWETVSALDETIGAEGTLGRETHALLKDGFKVSVPDPMHGGQKEERVKFLVRTGCKSWGSKD